MNPKPEIAVIGAGWAGLAAAAYLAPHCRLTLFEAGKVAGGRARSVAHGQFAELDNGQHLLIGAYRAVFRLLRRVGESPDALFLREPLHWHLADGFQFRSPQKLPAPLHLLWAVLRGKNVDWAQKTALLRQMAALQRWHKRQPPDQSIASWLDEQRVGEDWRAQFWRPMVLGALNTPPETASLRVLCHVLADGVWASRNAGDFYMAKRNLSGTLAAPVLHYLAQHGAKYRPNCRIAQVQAASGKVQADGQTFDAAVFAVAPYHLAPLLPEHLGDTVRQAVQQLSYHAITTVYLRYPQPLHLPAALTGFAHRPTQWLLDRGRLQHPNEAAAIISTSDLVAESSLHTDGKPDWAATAHQDLLQLNPHLPPPEAQQTITEKRATVASTVNRRLPDMADLNAARIWLAGDWLHERYPATLEAAVQTGERAAQQCLAALAHTSGTR